MCGRYVSPDTAAIERQWQVGRRGGGPLPLRFNVSPAMPVPILLLEDGTLALVQARWGLVPAWWKESKPPRFSHNARVEEAAAKPMWREAKPCLVPAQGWYEWRDGDRQPFYFHRADERLVALAGLIAERPEGLSCAILTTSAEGAVARVHDRMPLALAPADEAAWLASRRPPSPDAAAIACHPVSRQVNSSRTEGAQLLEPARLESSLFGEEK